MIKGGNKMKISEAKEMAIKLKNQFGLTKWNVEFSKDMMYTPYGILIATTHHAERIFLFRAPFFAINGREFCRDQILHEIAHALTEYDLDIDIHGDVWRKKCIEIGAIPYTVNEFDYPYFYSVPEREVPK